MWFLLFPGVAVAAAPAVHTQEASSLGNTGARLYGASNPKGEASTAWFRFSTSHPGSCNDTFGTRAPSAGGVSLGSGTAHMVFSVDLSGLSSGTVYYYCAIAQNGSGKSYGVVHAFKQGGSPPSASTWSAMNLTATSVDIEGAAAGNGEATTAWLRYGATNPGVCDDAFGTRMPSSGGAQVGSTISYVPYSQSLSNLTPGTTYYFCAIAQNASGIDFGQLNAFTTPAVAPVVTTSSASGVTANSATLHGAANPRGGSTTGFFRYGTTAPGTCTTGYGTRAPSSGGTSLGSGNTSVPYSHSITGLQPGTTYYYCAQASNSGGTSAGSVSSFTTPSAPPSVNTSTGVGFNGTNASVSGTVNPNGEATTAWIRYDTVAPIDCDDRFGTRAPASGGSTIGAGTSNVSFNQTLSGLSLGTTYYACAIAENAQGISFGNVISFKTPDKPTVTTSSASSITSTAATLYGLAIPNGASTSGYFVWGTTNPGTCDETFGTATSTSSLGSGGTNVQFSKSISGLDPGATYYYCAVASNSAGAVFGAVFSFTTNAVKPTVSTQLSPNVTGSSVTFAGSASPGGGSTTAWFRYSTTSPGICNDTFGDPLPATGGIALGAGNTGVPFTQTLTGALPGTRYYYCAIAQNAVGTSFGSVWSVVVPEPPLVNTTVATPRPTDGAILRGGVNPKYGASTAWFRISTVDPGTCDDSFGTREPATGGSAISIDNREVPYLQIVTGLTAETTYYYCAIAANVAGTSFGPVVSFRMPGAPVVTTQPATTVTTNTAAVSVLLDPNGDDTDVTFQYGVVDPGTCAASFGPTRYMGSTSGNSGPTTLNIIMSGLTAGSTYYYCFTADNDWGRSNGQVLSVTLPTTSPSVVTAAASDISINGVTLNGQANPHGETTTAWFRYSTVAPGTCDDSFGTRVPATGGVALGSEATYRTYSETLTGLPLATTFYYCAIAQNAKGTSFGWVQSFSTPDVPAVTTDYFSYNNATDGVLRGTVNPRADEATGYFRYSTTDPGSCNDTFGTRTPATGGVALGSGIQNVSFNAPIAGLSAGTTYYFCALATNALGAGMGEVKTFKVMELPVVTTLPPVNVTGTTATLKASAIANGGTTYGWFRYADTDPGTCDDTFGTRRPWGTEPWDGQYLSSGYNPTEFSQWLSGLTAGTTWYYCAIAWNAAGYAYGDVESFTVPAAPLVTTTGVSGVTGTTATFEGSATPRAAETTGWFRYSTTAPFNCNDSFGTRVPATGGISMGSGAQAVSYSVPGAVLSPGTTYHYCAIASNAAGAGYGQVKSFTTPNAPLVSTSAATAVSGTSATLNGSANPRGDATIGWFRLASIHPGTCDDTFGMRVPATGGTTLGSGSALVPFDEVASGLSPGTTYYFCALARNGVGTVFGSVQAFVAPAPPTVTTAAATSVASTSATLNGTATPHGASTVGYFRLGTVDPGTCNDSFGTRHPSSGGTNVGSGTSALPFSQSVTGLSGATRYYYCAAASNTEGTRFGEVQTFQTAGAPTVATVSVTAEPAGVRLSGSATPNGLSTTGYFRYGTTSPGSSCGSTWGTRTPASGGTSLGSGWDPVPWTQTLTGLTGGTTWYFCAMATNSQGTASGAVMSVTVPLAPTVATLPASAVTSTAATFQGSADPRGSETTGWFRYATTSPGTCNDTFGTRAPASGGAALGSGNGVVNFSEAVTGLLPGTTYYVCAIAESLGGVRFGSVVSVTTPDAPSVTTLAVNAIGGASVTLRGAATPNGVETTAWLRYGATDPGTCDDSFGTRVPSSGGTALGAGFAAVNFDETVTGLATGTTYYVCAIASNPLGTTFGSVVTFTTLRPPAVSTVGASSITATGATLAGEGNPNGVSTTGWFRYTATDPGTCDDTFGTRAPTSAGTSLGSAGAPVAYTHPVSGLSPGSTYYFCAIASSPGGVSFGAVQSFTTRAFAPTVFTLPATGLTGTSVILSAEATPNAAPTTGWFRYAITHPGGCNDTFGSRIPATGGTSLGSGRVAVPFSETPSTLTPGTDYYYCAIASNAEGTRYGSVMSFTTPTAPTVTTSIPANVADTTASFGGTVNARGAQTLGWIRYGTTNPGTCNDSFGTRLPETGGIDVGSGSSTVPFALQATGLSPGTRYFVCAIAENVVGQSVGEVQVVRTLAPPQVSTGPASQVTDSSARLNGNAIPNGAASFGWFRLGTTDPGTCRDSWGSRVPSSGNSPLGAGANSVSYSRDVSNLIPGTRYYYCAIVQNAFGTSVGEVKQFQPAAQPPVVSTLEPSDVEGRSLTLQGQARPNRTATLAWFRYDTTPPAECSDGFGTRVPQNPFELGSGTSDVPFSVALEGLQPAVTYYYCAIAENLGGAAFGEVKQVTTSTVPPEVRTLPAEVRADGTILLNGAGTPHGLEATAWFRYDDVAPTSCDPFFGTQAGPQRASLGAGDAEVPFAQAVQGLAPGRYYYCGLVETSAGYAYGSVESFEISEAEPVGCGCASATGGAAAWIWLTGALLVRALRRRRSAADSATA